MTAVFESLRVKGNDLPLLERHIARLAANSRAAGLPPPPRDVPDLLLEAARAGDPDRVVRIEWDGERIMMTGRPLPSLEPMDIVVSSVVHTGYRIKTTDRELFDRAREEAHRRGADEALLLTAEGWVAEGSLFSIGWIDGGTLKVPSLDVGILPSIGRGRVIELAPLVDGGLGVEEGKYAIGELEGRPAFITTAVRGVVPIGTLEGRRVPSDPAIQELSRRFWELA